MTENVNKNVPQQKDINIFKMIGWFLAVFGMAMMVAIFFTEAIDGKVVNFISGALLLIIAAFALVKGKMHSNKMKQR